MSDRPGNPAAPPTVVVEALAGEGRDVASERATKRSLLARLEAGGPTPEELLSEWPTGPAADRDAAGLIYQDFRRQQQRGAPVNLEQYQQRFPDHADSLASLARQDACLRPLGVPEAGLPLFSLPEVGDSLFGFRLLHELGRGSFARVFLASQEDLASRPVVLKVSNLDGDEPQTMAMLQHTHIVPIYSLYENRAAGLRAVCMPYFGGASLSAVLKKAAVGQAKVRSGEDFVRALQAAQAPVPSAEVGEVGAGGPRVLSLLQEYSYPQVAAWVVARLAEGLQHSHSRGVLHRDIKPSNVLIGADGQPMLLDFNLAQVTRGERARVVIGGTIHYMAPEHLKSLAARDQALARQVDHRADIYSLGMVLYEMLVGHRPFQESASHTPMPLLIEAMVVERGRAAPSARASAPDVPWDLESVVGKCMAPRPEDRYQRAEHLAEDLQRFLEDRPLAHAPRLSLLDECRKWCRRHPRLVAAGGVAAVAATVVLALALALACVQQLLASARSSLEDTQGHLDQARARERQRAFRAAMTRALCQVNTTTDGRDQLRAGQLACEEALGLYQVLDREDWQDQPAWRGLDEQGRAQMAEEVRELLLLLAWAKACSAPGDAGALREALGLLERCEAVRGLPPLRALWEDRALYLERLGDSGPARGARAKAAAMPPSSARDRYLLATSHAREGRHADAVRELDEALRQSPGHYWSLVQRGICYREQGELLLAAGDFARCAGAAPDFAWGHYNLGCVLAQSRKPEQAVASFGAAVRCDPGFAPAYLNRGLALLELKQHGRALADLDRARALGRDDAILHIGRGTALEGLGEPGPAGAAFALAWARIQALPAEGRAPLLLRYGFAVYRRSPDAAGRAFAEVLRREAGHPHALYGQAMVLVEQGRESAAIRCFDEALAAHPGFADARRYRAVLLARAGELAAAQEEINRCLRLAPREGGHLYAAACVLARAAEREQGEARRRHEDEAIEFLGRAFRQGYGLTTAADDPDLRPLRRRQGFRALLRRYQLRATGGADGGPDK